ncbi:MAG: HEAT repeat domain-containing protein [Chloroflexota bacterium]
MEQDGDPETIPYATLAKLSGVSREEATELQDYWSYWPEGRVQEFFNRLNELVEEDVHMEFENIFFTGIDSKDSKTRALAATGLGESNHPSAVRRLTRLLRGDESEDVRVSAALSLGRFTPLAHEEKLTERQGCAIREALKEAFEDELETMEVRRRCLEAIAVFQDDVVEAFIEEAYEHEDLAMRQSAVHAMGRNCDEQWLDHVVPELDNFDPAVRYEATLALGQIGDESHIGDVSRMLDDEDLEVQVAAVMAIGYIGGQKATRTLRSLVRSQDPAVKQAANDALQYIEVEDMTIMSHDPQSEEDVRDAGMVEDLAEGYSEYEEDGDLYIDDGDLEGAGFAAPPAESGSSQWLDEEEDEWEDHMVLTDEDIEYFASNDEDSFYER